MMEDKGKVRKGFYIEEDLLEQMDGLLECKFCSNGTLILKSAVHLF